MSALTTFRLFAANPVTARENISNLPRNAREETYFRENIGNIKSADDLVSDQRIYSFVIQAYGLEDMSYAKAFMRKILSEGADDPNALANQLTDPRYLKMAQDFNFTRYGSATTTFEVVQTGTIDKFHQQKLELAAGDQNNGARLAMYFQRKSDGITSALSLLADPALLKFTQTAFGLPVEMSFASLEKQEAMINERLDVGKLSDPDFVDDLINRFLVSYDLENPDAISVPPLVLAPLRSFGISQDLLQSIQTLKSNR